MRRLLFAAASVAQGQSAYPTKNLRVIVPLPTGGPSNIVTRLLGDKLAQSLGKRVVIDNSTGAVLVLPDIRKRFGDMGLVTKHSTPEEFDKFLQSEIARWRALLAKKP